MSVPMHISMEEANTITANPAADLQRQPNRLVISVVIPAHDAADDLGHCLHALLNGDSVPDEIIVVDDGSTDGTAAVATAHGVTVLSVNGCKGAAYPRNVGSRHAKGDVLLFVDADVVVHSATVTQVRALFESDPDLMAMMGSYDQKPTCPELISQYRNLMHCYTHEVGRKQATTFWTGCGAVRKAAFQAVGEFDERLRAMEDIDLGRRLYGAGHRIELHSEIRCTHRKQWTFRKMVFTDVFHRGIPWTVLILREGRGMPDDLNLKWTQRLGVLGVGLLVLLAAFAVYNNSGRFLTPLLGAALLVSGTYWITQMLRKGATSERVTFATFFAAYVSFSYELQDLLGPTVVASGYLFLFLRHLFLKDHERAQRAAGRAYGVFLVAALTYLIFSMPARYEVFLFWVLGIGVIALNAPFYIFLCRNLGLLYGLATVPFHLLFHLYGGVSFGMGVVQYWLETRKHGGRQAA